MTFDELLARNPVCRLLGIEVPVLQAGMFTVAYGQLAAAVSKAGGLGCIGSAYMDPEDLRREIRLVKDETDKPFAVDILFAEVKSEDATTSAYTQEVEDHIAVTFEEGVPVIVSGLGNPGRIVPRAKAAGVKVMSLVGTSRQARKVEAAGVDAVIASGHEGGGHVGRVGTLPLVAAAVNAVSIPVIAAGGISDGRGLAAALALGAQGVWLGTRFIATEEARAHANYKGKIVEIDEDGTIVSRANSGKTARMLRNSFTAYWAAHEADIKPYPYQLREVGEAASYRGRIEGDTENGVLPMGQSAGTISAVKPAGDVVRDVVEEARAVFAGWGVA
jgi:enoyl-[acyl-carrier protein] reductase II